MVSFLRRTDIQEVRYRVTDRQTDTQTDPTTVTLIEHVFTVSLDAQFL